MQLDTLHSLFVEELRDLYDAENQVVQALPKMAGAASQASYSPPSGNGALWGG